MTMRTLPTVIASLMTFVIGLHGGIVASCCVTASSSELSAGTGPQFYVATTGDDSQPGSSAQPWRTIQKAMTSATPGSTVNIHGGTYHERLSVEVSGTAGNYVTFQPYGFSVPSGGCGGYTGVACGGDQVVLDYAYLGTVSDGIPFLLVSGKSYLRIQGITFENFTTFELNGVLNQGVRVDGSSSSVEFKYNRFLNNRDTAPWNGTSAFAHIRVWGPSSNIWFYGNELGWIVSNYSEALTADGPGQSHLVVENNWIHDTDGIAIDLQHGAHDYVIRANRLEYISKKRDGTIWYGNPSIAIYNDGGNTGTIEGNYVSEAGVGLQALSEPGQSGTHHITIRGNVVQRSIIGIVIGTWYSNTDGSSVSDLSVLNNTFYGNDNGVVIRPMISSTVVWKNNIFADNLASYVNTLGWPPGTSDYNLYYGGGAGPGLHFVTADPKLANPDRGDFTLLRGSAAIDAGDPGTSSNDVGQLDFRGLPRVVNARVDVGANEAQ
jgi:hypothetical protein